jgi:hypothetical protein
VIGHIAIPWITDYLDELRAITAECERPQFDGTKCIQCREKDRIIGQIEEIIKEHGNA